MKIPEVERATFRPPIAGLGPMLLLGSAGGAAVGALLEVPLLLAAVFGAAAAGIALAARQASGLRAVADAEGLRVLGGGSGLAAPWNAVRLGFGMSPRDDGSIQRYAIVADPRGRSFAFADRSGARPCRAVTGADGRPLEVVDLRDAALLLALVVQRTPAWNVLPESLREPRPVPAQAGAAAAEPVPGPRAARPARARIGLWGVAAKLGSKLLASLGKIGAGLLKAVKTANLGWAAASVATYGLLFSWKFALAIMVQLFVHEYGHVHAMRRTGMKVRGMYFIPFLGALAVTEDAFSSRRQQAYVALSGPIWGSLLALLPAGLFLWTREPMWAAIAAWWALINLFNLLPIAPLDGGRVMQAFAFSYSSGLGLAVSILGLAGAVALGAALDFSLIYLVATLGAMELVSESQARAGARALRLLPEPARFGVPQWAYLHAVLGPPPGSPGEGFFVRNLERQQQAARSAPMRPWELAGWGTAYAALAAGLVLLIWLMRTLPGAEAAAGILG
jgi:Zn-dependent protease